MNLIEICKKWNYSGAGKNFPAKNLPNLIDFERNLPVRVTRFATLAGRFFQFFEINLKQ